MKHIFTFSTGVKPCGLRASTILVMLMMFVQTSCGPLSKGTHLVEYLDDAKYEEYFSTKRESAARKISEAGITDEVKGGPFLYYSVGNIWVAVHRIGDNFNVLTGTDKISSRYSMLSGKREMGSLFDFARSWGGYRYRYRESRPLPMGNYCAVFDGDGNILIEFDSPTASATRRMGGKPWGGMGGPKMRRLPFTPGQKKVLDDLISKALYG